MNVNIDYHIKFIVRPSATGWYLEVMTRLADSEDWSSLVHGPYFSKEECHAAVDRIKQAFLDGVDWSESRRGEYDG